MIVSDEEIIPLLVEQLDNNIEEKYYYVPGYKLKLIHSIRSIRRCPPEPKTKPGYQTRFYTQELTDLSTGHTVTSYCVTQINKKLFKRFCKGR